MTTRFEARIQELCQYLMLPIPAEYHDGVAENFARLTEQARLVMEFPLPEDIEPAALFSP